MPWTDHVTNAGKFISDGLAKFKEFTKDHPKIKESKFGKFLHGDAIHNLVNDSKVNVDNLHDIATGGFWKRVKASFSEMTPGGIAHIGTAAMRAGGDLYQGNTAGALATIMDEGNRLFSQAASATDGFRKGDWVLIDSGHERLTKDKDASAFWGEGSIFQDMASGEDQELQSERVITVGFIVEPNAAENECDVFQLEDGDTRRYQVFDLRHVTAARATALDSNEDMKLVKDIILGVEIPAYKVQTTANLDPDAEVVYDGKTYRVLSAEGTQARIQNAEHTLTVDAKSLSRGRTEHTNAWIYGKTTDAGFDRDVKAPLHKGMWIWVRARDRTREAFPKCYKELAVVRLLNGDKVDGYYALDGARLQVDASTIEVVPQERQTYLSRHRHFKEFRHRAVIGSHNVRDFSLGPFHPRTCVGLGDENMRMRWSTLKTMEGEEEGQITPGLSHAAAPVEPGQTPKDEVITGTDPLPLLDADYEADRRWGLRWEEAGRGEGIDLQVLSGKKSETGAMVYVLALAGICGAAYFLS